MEGVCSRVGYLFKARGNYSSLVRCLVKAGGFFFPKQLLNTLNFLVAPLALIIITVNLHLI